MGGGWVMLRVSLATLASVWAFWGWGGGQYGLRTLTLIFPGKTKGAGPLPSAPGPHNATSVSTHIDWVI